MLASLIVYVHRFFFFAVVQLFFLCIWEKYRKNTKYLQSSFETSKIDGERVKNEKFDIFHRRGSKAGMMGTILFDILFIGLSPLFPRETFVMALRLTP